MIRAAKRPVIYAGGGIISSDASEELRALVAKTGIPVTTTLMGLGGFPGDDPLSLDMLGMHGSVYANYAVDNADLLLALGVRFDDRVTGKVSEFASRAKIVHVDIDPSEINKIKKADLADLQRPEVRARRIEQDRRSARLDRMAPQSRGLEARRAVPLQPRFPRHPAAARHPRTVPARPRTATRTSPRAWASTRCGPPSTTSSASRGAGCPVGAGHDGLRPARRRRREGRPSRHARHRHRRRRQPADEHPGNGHLLLREAAGQGDAAEQHAPGHGRAVGRPLPRRQSRPHVSRPDRPSRGHRQGNGITPQERYYPDFIAIAHGFGWDGRSISAKKDLVPAIKEMIAADGPYLLDVQVPYQEHVLPMIPADMTVRDLIKE